MALLGAKRVEEKKYHTTIEQEKQSITWATKIYYIHTSRLRLRGRGPTSSSGGHNIESRLGRQLSMLGYFLPNHAVTVLVGYIWDVKRYINLFISMVSSDLGGYRRYVYENDNAWFISTSVYFRKWFRQIYPVLLAQN